MAEANNKLSGQGLILGSQTTDEIANHDEAGTSKVLLYASGSGAASKLYMKAGSGVQKPLGTDVESLPAMSSSLVEGDLFMLADVSEPEGNEFKVTFGTITGSVYSNISGDITVGTNGVSAIGTDKVHGTMLNSDAADGTTLTLSDNSLSVLKVPSALTAGTGLSAGGTFDGANDRTISVAGAQTTIESILKSDFTKIGTDEAQEYIDFSTSDEVNVHIDNSKILGVKAAGVDVVGTISGSVAVQGGAASFVSLTTSGNTIIGGNLTVNGVTTQVDTTNLQVKDKNILLNDGGAVNSAAGAGIDFEENSLVTGYIRVADDDRTNLDLKAPGGSELKLDINENKTITVAGSLNIEADSAINQDLTTNANVTFANISGAALSGSGNLNLDGNAQFNGSVVIKPTKSFQCSAVDIDGGHGDNLIIGSNQPAAGTFTTLTANTALVVNSNASIVGDTASEIQLNVKAHESQSTSIFNVELSDGIDKLTVSNTGVTTAASLVATTADINGGTVDAVIGGTTPAAGTFTTVAGATGSFSAGAEASALSVVGGATFKGIGATATGPVGFFSNGDDSNAIAAFISGSGATENTHGLHLRPNVARLKFSTMTPGQDPVAGIGYFNTGNALQLSGSQNLVLLSSKASNRGIELGQDGGGVNVTMYGAANDEGLFWNAGDNTLTIKNSSGAAIVTMGGDLDAEYGITVGTANTPNSQRILAGAYEVHSDRDLKKDIEPMTDGLERVMKLQPVTYEMKANPGQSDFGFIAQDVAKVAPEIVGLDKDGIGRSIDYSRMSALLAGAVKAQQLQIDELKTIISKLQK